MEFVRYFFIIISIITCSICIIGYVIILIGAMIEFGKDIINDIKKHDGK
jgi:hypothetical protein